jgi:hypothetical protein
MIVALLVWLFLAPLGAWVIGAGIRVAEQRRPVDVDDAAGDLPCQASDDAAEQLAAVSA